MQKKHNYLSHFVLYIFIFLSNINISAEQINIPDSLLTTKYIYKYTFTDQEKAKHILLLMRERKLDKDYLLDIAEGDLLFNNGKCHQALVLYTQALNNKTVQQDPIEYMDQLHRIISCYDGLHNEEKKTEYVKLLLDKAEETGNKEMKSVALFNMGKMIYYQQDKEHGYQLIKEAIEIMQQSDYKNKYYNLRYNYNTLIMMQQRDGQYEEALNTLDNLESILTKVTQNQVNVDGLNDKEKKTLLAWRAVILASLGRTEEADKAYEQWEITAEDYTKDDYLITSYLMQRKLFNKVIETYGATLKQLQEQNDTINYHTRSLKRILGNAYEGKGDYKEATKYFQELAILTDSLKIREQKSNAVELATIYDTHQKEKLLQEQAQHLKIRNILLISAVIIILLLIVLLIRKIMYSRVIKFKNKKMTITIEELLVKKDLLYELNQEVNYLREKQKNENFSQNTTLDSNPNIDNNITEDQRLFETLDNIVIQKKLYLDPNLSREDMMRLIEINKNRFAQMIQQYTGGSSTTYINDKRLEYAVKLLKTHPQYTVSGIATMCGIPNTPTFNRLFKTKYGMTPAEFKTNVKSLQ